MAFLEECRREYFLGIKSLNNVSLRRPRLQVHVGRGRVPSYALRLIFRDARLLRVEARQDVGRQVLLQTLQKHVELPRHLLELRAGHVQVQDVAVAAFGTGDGLEARLQVRGRGQGRGVGVGGLEVGHWLSCPGGWAAL